MSVVVAGTIRFDPAKWEAAQPHFRAMLAATREEDGCVVYSFGRDVEDPGLLRVFEIWRDVAALDAHGKTAHMAAFRATWGELGLADFQIKRYPLAD